MPRKRLTAALHVRLEPELARELDRAAAAADRTPSAIARALIREGLERRRATTKGGTRA